MNISDNIGRDVTIISSDRPQPFTEGFFNISDTSLKLIREIMMETQGFDVDCYKNKCIVRRIATRIRLSGYRTPEEYIEFLRRDKRETLELLNKITINVSEFFRNTTVFEKLKHCVLPSIFNERNGLSPVKIWSVGCAGGEEPYSVAIILREYFKAEASRTRISILATDIDKKSLEDAAEAIYSKEKLSSVPPELKTGYFDLIGNKYRLTDNIRQMVRFRHEDIFHKSSRRSSDLIICRNMLIYMSRERQEQLLLEFWNDLCPGGFLLIGRAETLIGKSRELFSTYCSKERFYRKIV